MRNGGKALVFSVLLYQDEKPFIILGYFRVMDGQIHPPAIGKAYAATAGLSLPVAQEIYDLVAESGWIEKYELEPLQPREKAIRPLTLTAERLRYLAPSLVDTEMLALF